MKKIDTTNITGNQKAPYIKATHDHIKESIQDTTGNIIKGLLGSYTTGDLIVLYGCVVTANIPGTSSITAGAIYYNGEIYEVDANASLITTGSDTLVWGVVTDYRSGDPVTWSDGVDRDLHRVDKLALSAGASGSGLANYNGATVKYMLEGAPIYRTSAGVESVIPRLKTKIIEIGDWNMDATSQVDVNHGIGADFIKIRVTSVVIINDASNSISTLYLTDTLGGMDGGVVFIDSTKIRLFRVTGGSYDSTSFDSTSFNRGWVTIEY